MQTYNKHGPTMIVAATQSGERKGGILALLDLPVGSVLNLDGATVVLKRDDFVGFHSIPVVNPNSLPVGSKMGIFHAVTVRAGATVVRSPETSDLGRSGATATTVGFVFLSDCEANSTLVRRFDPRTEEVSVKPEDKDTAFNLCNKILQGKIEPHRVVFYEQFIPPTKSEKWNNLTKFISPRLLKLRGIEVGGKLVPGAYLGDTDANQAIDDTTTTIADGVSVTYPHIPVLTTSHSTRHALHSGTKLFMKDLTPAARTAFFTADNPESLALEHLLTNEYGNQYDDLLGDVQLSYIIFLNLHCFSSLTHWRDLVAMISFVDADGMINRINLFESLFNVLAAQVATVEDDFFDDVEFSSDNFLVPALLQLAATAKKVVTMNAISMSSALATFTKLLQAKFPNHFCTIDTREQDDNPWVTPRNGEESKMLLDYFDSGYNSCDDEDGPAVVSAEEVKKSTARSIELSRRHMKRHFDFEHEVSCLSDRFPLLAAAMDPNTEDILMTCARVLGDAVDVSLVREAAAYLEEVEAKRNENS